MSILKKIAKIGIPTVILFILAYFVINIFAYFDPFNSCLIWIDGDILRGNTGTIRQAIKIIKNKNPESYKNTCRYLNAISENYCVASRVSAEMLPGCYIKGSKTIYLNPENGAGENIINARAEQIEKLAEKSKEFWQGK